MRVLVTGAAGFIGSYVVRNLLQSSGDSVYALLRPQSNTHRLLDYLTKLEVVSVDLSDEREVRRVVTEIRPELAIHLAWYAVPGEYWTAAQNIDCVSWSLALARILAESGCRRLVVAGTCAEYDWNYGFLSEEVTPVAPKTLYGASKHALHLVLEKFLSPLKIELAWGRFFFLYGPSESKDKIVSNISLSLLDGLPAVCRNGDVIRDFLHIDDAASALCMVAKSGLTGGVNIASGIPLKIKTLVETIGQVTENSRNIVFESPSKSSQEVPFIVGDNRKLLHSTSWEPRFTLELGIRNTVAWLKKNRSLV